jgi:hypothetical protein
VVQDRVLRLARVRSLLRHQLVEDRAQGVDIGPGVERLFAPRLLGRHVRGRPQRRPRLGRRARLLQRLQLGDPEVEHLHQVGPVLAPADEQVVGLEVAVHDPSRVGGGHAPAGLRDQVGGARQRQPPVAFQQPAQALADQQLHHDVRRPVLGDAEVDGGGDVLVLQPARRRRLPLKSAEDVAALGQVPAQQLDREAAPDQRVLGFVDHRHPATRQQANHPVLSADHLADAVGLGGRPHRNLSASLRIVSRSIRCPSISR